jgi:hypothetical protein
MKRLLTLLAILLSMTINAQELSQHRWTNRLIVLLGSDEAETTLEEQVAILAANEDSLDELKLLVYQFKKGAYCLGICAEEGWQTSAVPTFLAEKMTSDAPFHFFLIGLDGSVKMHRTRLVSMAEVSELINQMPMRRAELINPDKF